ncbi:polyprotein [Stralarivirus elaterii]|uniref:Polyprotein n=1 Tax=Cohombrillo associated virus TaxID=3016143 RepID=A0A9F1UDC6_9VIRU|nr:polyprotein [Cohombrillo associated virus]
MGRTLKYVSPADFKKKQVVNASNGSAGNQNARARCAHGLVRPAPQCTSACYKIFYKKENKGLGVVGDTPKAGRTFKCPNCHKYFSKRAQEKHLREYAEYSNGHYLYHCIPDTVTSVAELDAMMELQLRVARGLKARDVPSTETHPKVSSLEDEKSQGQVVENFMPVVVAPTAVVESQSGALIFGNFGDNEINLSTSPIVTVFPSSAVSQSIDTNLLIGSLEISLCSNSSSWLDFVTPVSHKSFSRSYGFRCTVEMEDPPLIKSLSNEDCNTQFSIVENLSEKDLCCAYCATSGWGNCEIIQVLADEKLAEEEAFLDEWDHRARNYEVYADLLSDTSINRIGRPKRLPKAWKASFVRYEQIFIEKSIDAPCFYKHLVDADLIVRRLPLIGKTPLELMAEYCIVPSGNVMLDIDRALYEENRRWTYSDGNIVVDGVLYTLSFDCWRDSLLFYLIRALRGPLWTQTQFQAYLCAPLPDFLKGFPEHQYEKVAAGSWNPFRYLTKQATLGFLDGLLAKIQELFGSAWKACTMLSDIFKRMFDKLTNNLKDLMGTIGKCGALTDCALPLIGLLGATGALWLLAKFSCSIGVPTALIAACGLGICMFVMCKYLQMAHHEALRKSQLFWQLSKSLFGEGTPEDIAEQVEIELKEMQPELYEQLLPLEREDPVYRDHHMDEMVASDGDFLLHTGVLWKLILLLIPVTCVGFRNTVSTAKDLTVLYGGKETAGKFTQDFIGGVQETYYHITGKHAEFLGYLYTSVGIDFEQWRSEVVLYTTSSPQAMFLSISDRLQQLRKLRDQGETLSLQMGNHRVPTPYLTSFNDTLKNLDKALMELNQALAVGTWRTTPFCIWLYGPSHVGKSVCSQYLIDDILNELDYPQTGRLYARNGTDPFFSCYKHQSAVLYDDFGAVQEGAHFDEAEIMRLIAPAPAPLNMANLEAKGNTCFTSDFVFMTANQCGLSPSAVVHNKAAFENRRNIVVQVEAVPGGKYRDRYRFHVLYRNEPYARVQGLEDMTYDAFLSYCVEGARAFKEEQQQLTGAPHGSIFEALKAIRAEAECEFATLADVAPLADWLEVDYHANTITTLTDLIKIRRESTTSEQLFIREFMGPGLISRIGRVVSKAAYANLRNQIERGINPLLVYADEFRLTKLERLMATSISPAVTEEQLLADKACFKEKVSGWFADLREKVNKLPFWTKLLLGAAGVMLIGYPLFRYLQGFWTCSSVGDFFALGSGTALVAAGGSLSSSQDQFTRRAKSGKDRRRYEMIGSSWDNKDEEVSEKERKPNSVNDNPILKYVLGFQSFDDPNCKVRALSLGGTRVAMVYHVWLALLDGVYQVTSLEKSFPFALRKSKATYQRIGKKDLVVIDFPPTFVSFPVFSKQWLLSSKDVVGASVGMFANVTFANRHVMDLELEEAHYATNNSIQTYDSDLLKGIGLGLCMKYLIASDDGKSYQSDFFVRSQCGSLLLAYPLGRKAGLKILSLHCMHILTARVKAQGAKGGREGFGTILTVEELTEAELILGEPNHVLEEDLIIASSPAHLGEFAEAQTVCPLGLLKPSEVPAQASKTAIVPSCISPYVKKELGINPTTAPAILTKKDERLKDKDVDILRVGMLKYKQVAADMSPLDEEEDEIFYDVLDEMFLPYQDHKEHLSLLTESENLNGIAGEAYCDPVVMSSSEGYDWVLSRKHGEKGKARLVQGVPGLYSIDWESNFGKAIIKMRKLCATQIPCIIGLDTPKDERLPLSKIYDNPKTRLFTILPFEYNYLVREFFGSAIFHMMRKHNDTPMKVGINPLGMEWTIFGRSLHSQGLNWFNGDYSRFDGVTPRCLLIAIADKFTELYGDEYRNHRLHLMLAATTRLSIAGWCLYRVSGGIPSGFALTVIVNSLVNQFLVQWGWKQLVGSARFSEHVTLGVYGDDNICSVSNKYKDKFNLVTLSNLLAKYGFTLKDGSNKDAEVLPCFNPPEKCDFLKRSFIPYGDRYLAPLADRSRTERLFWIREGGLSPEIATIENIISFLEETFQDGDKQSYDKWRRDLITICAAARLDIPPLASYREQEVTWLAGRSLQLVDPDAKPEHILIKNAPQEIMPGVRIDTLSFLKRNADSEEANMVWCGPNCPANLRHNLSVHVVEAPYGQKYPLRATFRNTCRKLKSQGKCVIFGGALDQDLVYFCASFYASYISNFSFTTAMQNYFGEDDSQFLKAKLAASGW